MYFPHALSFCIDASCMSPVQARTVRAKKNGDRSPRFFATPALIILQLCGGEP